VGTAAAEHGATLWSARGRGSPVGDRFERSATISAVREGPHSRVSTLPSGDPPHAALRAARGSARPRSALDLRRGRARRPHRDDLATLDGHDLRAFGSAGQHRTAAIALRMLEAATWSGPSRAALLLDGLRFDASRLTHFDLLTRDGLGQTVLAVPREVDIPIELTRLDRLRVVAGSVTPFSGT
jgi:DNA replication and repair protein RecF